MQMRRFSLLSLFLVTGVIALLLVVAMRVPVPSQTRIVIQRGSPAAASQTPTRRMLVVPQHPPATADVLLRLLVWLPWTIGAWVGLVFLWRRSRISGLPDKSTALVTANTDW